MLFDAFLLFLTVFNLSLGLTFVNLVYATLVSKIFNFQLSHLLYALLDYR